MYQVTRKIPQCREHRKQSMTTTVIPMKKKQKMHFIALICSTADANALGWAEAKTLKKGYTWYNMPKEIRYALGNTLHSTVYTEHILPRQKRLTRDAKNDMEAQIWEYMMGDSYEAYGEYEYDGYDEYLEYQRALEAEVSYEDLVYEVNYASYEDFGYDPFEDFGYDPCDCYDLYDPDDDLCY